METEGIVLNFSEESIIQLHDINVPYSMGIEREYSEVVCAIINDDGSFSDISNTRQFTIPGVFQGDTPFIISADIANVISVQTATNIYTTDVFSTLECKQIIKSVVDINTPIDEFKTFNDNCETLLNTHPPTLSVFYRPTFDKVFEIDVIDMDDGSPVKMLIIIVSNISNLHSTYQATYGIPTETLLTRFVDIFRKLNFNPTPFVNQHVGTSGEFLQRLERNMKQINYDLTTNYFNGFKKDEIRKYIQILSYGYAVYNILIEQTNKNKLPKNIISFLIKQTFASMLPPTILDALRKYISLRENGILHKDVSNYYRETWKVKNLSESFLYNTPLIVGTSNIASDKSIILVEQRGFGTSNIIDILSGESQHNEIPFNPPEKTENELFLEKLNDEEKRYFNLLTPKRKDAYKEAYYKKITRKTLDRISDKLHSRSNKSSKIGGKSSRKKRTKRTKKYKSH